ncbi:MAG: sigma-70 family RNA polymerase sigma factor [Bacteroidia bacterium]|nr:sigma-70 family RNA polymerase sigma factor [Bacteroidia bacterium]
MADISKILAGSKEYLSELFLEWYPFIYRAILRYYSPKNFNAEEKSAEVFEAALHRFTNKANHSNKPNDFRHSVIEVIVEEIKSYKSEYFIASTVYPDKLHPESHTLFENYELIDYNSLTPECLYKALSELSPPKRLTFNLHEIDGYTPEEIAVLLEVGLPTVKMNLEKAKYELQKSIEKQLRQMNHGKSIQI